MRIFITGARGNFATALDRRLAPDNDLVLYDIEPMGAPDNGISIQGDIRDAAALTHAMRGCDAVIHSAALSESQLSSRNYDDFYSANVTGTQNVLRAMLLNEIKCLVFSSSDAVCGAGIRGRVVLNEETPCIPTDFYAMTKLLGEDLCRFYARQHGFHAAILRYGRFDPTNWQAGGIGLLNNRLDRDDVAQANELALGAVLAESFSCETFLIHSHKPFLDTDWPELTTDPAAVIERYYPGAVELLARYGLQVPIVHMRYDISKAVTWLGYDPQVNFQQFLNRLRDPG